MVKTQNPVRIHFHVVVRERDDFPLCCENPAVPRVRQALFLLEQVSGWNPGVGHKVIDNIFGVVHRIIVNQEKFPSGALRDDKAPETVQDPSHAPSPVIGAYDHGDLHQRRLSPLFYWNIPTFYWYDRFLHRGSGKIVFILPVPHWGNPWGIGDDGSVEKNIHFAIPRSRNDLFPMISEKIGPPETGSPRSAILSL